MKMTELFELIEDLPIDKKKIVEDLVTTLVSSSDTAISLSDIKPGFGGGKGIIGFIADDFDSPLEDFKDYM